MNTAENLKNMKVGSLALEHCNPSTFSCYAVRQFECLYHAYVLSWNVETLKEVAFLTRDYHN